MSDPKGNRRSPAPKKEEGVFVNLPRTRPQRSSPRRAAARNAVAGAAAGASTAAAPTTQPPPQRAHAKRPPTKRTSATRRPLKGSLDDSAPRQGYEAEREAVTGSVRPPGGTELMASAAEIVGDLAKAGLSTGERLLKDVFSRLPRS